MLRPLNYIETQKRVDVDVLKQRLLEEDRKDKNKRNMILSSIAVFLGIVFILTY